jgi:hypothetical protein
MTKKRKIRGRGRLRSSADRTRGTLPPDAPVADADKFAGIKAMFGIPFSRGLDLAAPMRLDVSRLGYDEEGLRLTFSIGSPFNFNAEVQLSDAEWLVQRVTSELADPRNANLPKGNP